MDGQKDTPGEGIAAAKVEAPKRTHYRTAHLRIMFRRNLNSPDQSTQRGTEETGEEREEAGGRGEKSKSGGSLLSLQSSRSSRCSKVWVAPPVGNQ